MILRSILTVILACFVGCFSVEAKSDSLKMAQKAEKKRLKEERKRQAEIERMAQPTFKGGDIDKFEAWILANLRKDFAAIPAGTPHVTVEVPFYVEADGSTTLSDEDTPSKRQYPRIVSEIERVILFATDWEPGHDAFGNPIRSRQVATITLKNRNHDIPEKPVVVRPRRPAPRRR
ncbi:MAG: hypothetical protein UHY58_04050 [Alistipes sp.]|nr:hypothetical protein [Alistipes sp.]